MISGVMISNNELRQLPKHALSLAEVEFAFSSVGLVKELRGIGALVPVGRAKQSLLFDAAEVSRVWAEFRNGDYNNQLTSWKGGLK